MAKGSKTVYRKELCERVLAYFESFIGFRERQLDKLEREASDEEELLVLASRVEKMEMLCREMAASKRLRGIPTLTKFAKIVGVHPGTISRWRAEHAEFDEACAACDRIQADLLSDGALSGIYSGRMATALLGRLDAKERARENQAAATGGLEDFEGEDVDG